MIKHGDCLKLFPQVKNESVDLIFADPPFNIGYEYDEYKDERTDYLDWTSDWLDECQRVLKPNGTIWVAIGDEFAAEVKIRCSNRFTIRNWAIWHYRFGQQTTKKFARCHTHLLYFVKNPKNFTFNPPLVPSARQLKYNDRRANPRGRIPGDVWEFPRVCGTHKERAGWHGCQMPEQLLGRIIRTCSNPGDLVLDPFAGSGSTLITAKKLGRSQLGFEISENYAAKAQERLAAASYAEPLRGVAP